MPTRCLMGAAIFVVAAALCGCSKPVEEQPKAAPSASDSRYPIQLFHHPMRTRLDRRGEIAEWERLAVGEEGAFESEYDGQGVQVRWQFLGQDGDDDRYRIRMDFQSANKQAPESVDRIVPYRGKRLVIHESHYHRVSFDPLETPAMARRTLGNGPCLVQQPEPVAPDAAIVIFLHGAGYDERQGMVLFPNLRRDLAERGWIYVCPDKYRLAPLLADLDSIYGNRRIFLAGASAGGRKIYQEIQASPDRFSGAVFLGPALYNTDLPAAGTFRIPAYFVYGKKDYGNTESARKLAHHLRDSNACPVAINELDGGHDAPCEQIHWWPDASTFIFD